MEVKPWIWLYTTHLFFSEQKWDLMASSFIPMQMPRKVFKTLSLEGYKKKKGSSNNTPKTLIPLLMPLRCQ